MKDTALGYPDEDEIAARFKALNKKEAEDSTRTTACLEDCLSCLCKDLERIEQASKE